jgi:hypothetical protein
MHESACKVELIICLSVYQVVKQGVHVGCVSAESSCSVELIICLSGYQVVKQGVHVGCMSAESVMDSAFPTCTTIVTCSRMVHIVYVSTRTPNMIRPSKHVAFYR